MKKNLSLLLLFIIVFYNSGFNGLVTLIKNFFLLFMASSWIDEICVTMYGNTILSELFSHLITFKLVGILLTIVALIVPSGRLLKYTGKVLYKIFDNIVSTILDNICKLI